MGHSVRVLREEDKGTISWRLKFRDGREKHFESPNRTTAWGSIKCASEYEVPSIDDMNSQELAHEPDYLKLIKAFQASQLTTLSNMNWRQHQGLRRKQKKLVLRLLSKIKS